MIFIPRPIILHCQNILHGLEATFALITFATMSGLPSVVISNVPDVSVTIAFGVIAFVYALMMIGIRIIGSPTFANESCSAYRILLTVEMFASLGLASVLFICFAVNAGDCDISKDCTSGKGENEAASAAFAFLSCVVFAIDFFLSYLDFQRIFVVPSDGVPAAAVPFEKAVVENSMPLPGSPPTIQPQPHPVFHERSISRERALHQDLTEPTRIVESISQPRT